MNQFQDVVMILDDDLSRLLDRPRQRTASIRTMAGVIDYALRLRARLAGQRVLVHNMLLDVAAELKTGGAAMGPVAALVDRYGEAAVDEPEVLTFFRTWISRCQQAR